MDGDRPSSADLRGALRRVHWSVLGSLAVCAVLIVANADPVDDGGLAAADRRYTLGALVLGVTAILARRQAVAPRTPPRLRVPMALGSLLLTVGIGLVGVALALRADEREAPLLFVLGAVILALRAAPGLIAADLEPRRIRP